MLDTLKLVAVVIVPVALVILLEIELTSLELICDLEVETEDTAPKLEPALPVAEVLVCIVTPPVASSSS